MAEDNRYTLMRILDQVCSGLAPYVVEKYRDHYGDVYLRELWEKIDLPRGVGWKPGESHEKVLNDLDAARALKALVKAKPAFFDRLGVTSGSGGRDFNCANAFNFAYELLSARHAWAHASSGDQFDDEDIHRVAASATRLLIAIGADENAQATREIMRTVGKRLYSIEADLLGRKLVSVERDLVAARQQVATLKHEVENSKQSESSAKTEVTRLRRQLRSKDRRLDTSSADHKSAVQAAPAANDELTNDELKAMRREVLNMLQPKYRELEELSAPRGSTGRATTGEPKVDTPKPANNRAKSHLIGAKILGGELSGKDLSGRNLTGANLQRANLSGANLSRAVLRDADLSGSDLTHANLTRADLTGAIMKGVELQGVRYGDTILPDGSTWTQRTNLRPYIE